MTAVLRTPAAAVWVILIIATGVSWALGTQQGMLDHRLASVIILLIAFIKVRFVGMYFVEFAGGPERLARLVRSVLCHRLRAAVGNFHPHVVLTAATSLANILRQPCIREAKWKHECNVS